MTFGSGIFASTVLVILAIAIRQITQRNKWKLVGKIAAGTAVVCVALGTCLYAWEYIASRPPAPSLLTELAGAKLGMSPTEVKLALGKPDYESDPTVEGKSTRIDLSYSSPSIFVTFYGSDKYSTKAEIICSRDYQANIFGINNFDTEETVLKRLGPPDSTSINSDGLKKMISYAKWKVSFTISKGQVAEKCIHTDALVAFTNELKSPAEQRAADLKAAADEKAAALAAAAFDAKLAAEKKDFEDLPKAQPTPKQQAEPTGDLSDACAPELTKAERLRRLALYGAVRQTGSNMYEAGGHAVAFFYDGSLLTCR